MDADFSYVDKIHYFYKNQIINEDYHKQVIHYHNGYEIMFIANADNKLFIKDKTYLMKSKQLLLIPPYTIHTINYNSETKYSRYVLTIENDYLLPLLTTVNGEFILYKIDNIQSHLLDLDIPVFNKIHAEFINLEFHFNNFLSNKNLENEIRMLLTVASLLVDIYKIIQNPEFNSQNIESGNNIIQNVINYLNNNYMESISLEKIEKLFHTSKYYICHRFKETTGTSIINFLNLIRVTEAQKLLSENKYSISEISYRCGFNNIQHFYRIYKKITDCTPGKYKNR